MEEGREVVPLLDLRRVVPSDSLTHVKGLFKLQFYLRGNRGFRQWKDGRTSETPETEKGHYYDNPQTPKFVRFCSSGTQVKYTLYIVPFLIYAASIFYLT